MGCTVPTLLSEWGSPLLYLFSPLSPLEQALLVHIVEKLLVFLAKLETMAIVA